MPVNGFLNATAASLDDICRHGADKGVERVHTDRRSPTSFGSVGVSVLCPGPTNTNIAYGAPNRPSHMGGPQVRANEEAVLAEPLADAGLAWYLPVRAASDSERAAYLLIEYGPWLVPRRT